MCLLLHCVWAWLSDDAMNRADVVMMMRIMVTLNSVTMIMRMAIVHTVKHLHVPMCLTEFIWFVIHNLHIWQLLTSLFHIALQKVVCRINWYNEILFTLRLVFSTGLRTRTTASWCKLAHLGKCLHCSLWEITNQAFPTGWSIVVSVRKSLRHPFSYASNLTFFCSSRTTDKTHISTVKKYIQYTVKFKGTSWPAPWHNTA